MEEFPVWALAGLLFGTVLGVVGAFGGLNAFLIVLVLGIVGFFVGLILEGGVHMPTTMHPRRQ
ncbi:hypothetical protein GCM10009530_34370 [Microbispora corallina]|uniref:DUF2273 domain-containing protein n=1 Tax=Microbispora corallina TaxID=83302 RepID=A0ABQ4G1M7_9ACTN|nr:MULTISPECIES: hypothetical protein [Microbispora]ETK35498.1 hypothetical protein MPTA5024_13800 [Microbispora sp. ATCC PTA-5024]GIH40988.1 hypothetical protein Mco01_39880 [Microbispora corallina]